MSNFLGRARQQEVELLLSTAKSTTKLNNNPGRACQQEVALLLNTGQSTTKLNNSPGRACQQEVALLLNTAKSTIKPNSSLGKMYSGQWCQVMSSWIFACICGGHFQKWMLQLSYLKSWRLAELFIKKWNYSSTRHNQVNNSLGKARQQKVELLLNKVQSTTKLNNSPISVAGIFRGGCFNCRFWSDKVWQSFSSRSGITPRHGTVNHKSEQLSWQSSSPKSGITPQQSTVNHKT